MTLTDRRLPLTDSAAYTIDPESELADVLDSILRDLGQVIECDHVRVLLLASVLRAPTVLGLEDADDDALVAVRDRGSLGAALPARELIRLDQYPLNRQLMETQRPIVISDTAQSERWVEDGMTLGIRAWIGAPLVVKGESIGVLTLHSRIPKAYTERDGKVVFAFASQAAEAIDKVRLLDQAQGRLQAMMALYDASLDVISQAQEPDRLLLTLVEHAVDLLRAEAGAIYVLQPDRQSLRLMIAHGFADEYRGVTLAVGEGLAGRIVETGQAVIVDDYQTWPGRAARYAHDARLSAILGVPLKWQDEVIGVLEICADCAARTFGDEDRWLGELFANQAAIAMSNARLVEQSQRRLTELMATRNVMLQMTSTLDLKRVLDTICANVMSLTDAEDTHIYLYDTEHDRFSNAVALWRSGARKPAVTQPRRDGLTDRVRRSGRPIVIDDAPTHELYSSPQTQSWGIQSIAGLPLKRADRTLGVFTVAYVVPHHFTDDELRVLSLLADQAAIAIENARLYEATQYQLKVQSRLYSVITLLRSTLNLDDILSTVASAVSDLLDLQSCSVGLFDDEQTAWLIGATSGAGPQQVKIPIEWIPADLRDPVLAMTSMTMVNVPEDIAAADRPRRLFGLADGRSVALCPIVGQDRVLGLIGLVSSPPRAFAPDEIDLLRALSNQASSAIGNARLYAETQYRLEIQSRLYHVITLLRSTLNVDEILNAVATTVYDLFHPLVCTISLIDHARGVITYPVVRGGNMQPPDIPLSALPQNIVQTGLSGQLMVLDSLDDYPNMQKLYQLPARCGMMIVPIVGQKQTQGVLTLVTRDRPRYLPDQIESVKALANQAAIAIDNALAYQERQAALAERERTQQALIRSESLAAVGQLVAGVAHELNNPLATVSSLIQSALETLGLPYTPPTESSGQLPAFRPDQLKPLSAVELVELTDDLAFSLKEMRRAKSIVSSLLDLSRQSSSYTEEVSLTVVCQDALRVLSNKLKSLPLEIVEAYDDRLPVVRGNFANLGQVALNIIQNAAEAFDKRSGRIEIGTDYDRARNVVSFYVSDNGPGIPAEVLPNIFNPFFTTKLVGVGTGLGLYISYEIVKKHGGEIVVETEAGNGTLFRVELPRAGSGDQESGIMNPVTI